MKNGQIKKGFSLIELLIVIVILGTLAALIMPNLLDKADKAKADLVCIQMKSVSQALDFFKSDNGSYPTTEEGLKALSLNPDSSKYQFYAKNGYFKDGIVPKDSFGREFIYLQIENKFDIISLGSDGKESSDDIKYRECLRK